MALLQTIPTRSDPLFPDTALFRSMATRVGSDSVGGSVIRICAEVARRASSRAYRAETHEHGFRHAPYRKNRNEPGRANMLPRARPDNILNLPRSERVGGKRHDRLFASRNACRERLRLRQHALDEIIGDGAFGVVLRRIAGDRKSTRLNSSP